jgi:hypothetical protein
MGHSVSFLTLCTVSLLALLVIALSAAVAQSSGNEAQTRPYVDPLATGDSTPSGCSSMFRILDLNDRLSLEEYCAPSR